MAMNSNSKSTVFGNLTSKQPCRMDRVSFAVLIKHTGQPGAPSFVPIKHRCKTGVSSSTAVSDDPKSKIPNGKAVDCSDAPIKHNGVSSASHRFIYDKTVCTTGVNLPFCVLPIIQVAIGYTSLSGAVDHYLKSRGFNGPFFQIELSFSASNLQDRDVTSKGDAMVVVYTKRRDGKLAESLCSEVVLNSLNPKWNKKFTVRYQSKVLQTLLFRAYDIDTQFQNSKEEMLKLDKQQFLGEATCTLSEVITKSNRTIALELMRKEGTQPQDHGKLIVHAEESLASKTTTEMGFRCLNLESMDHFSKSDPFLVISTIVEQGASISDSKTDVLKNESNPVWKPVNLNVQQVGSKDSPLVIEWLDFNGNGNHSLIG